MDRNRRGRWAWNILRLIASWVVVCACCLSVTRASPAEEIAPLASTEIKTSEELPNSKAKPAGSKPPCIPRSSTPDDHFVLLVSTLDGSVSALDMRTNGKILWSVKMDERPLLSSSITNIQVTRNGVPTRLIPSLDGGLYEFDGEDVKEIPMTVETLLSSSVRVTDNSVMVGGKEVSSFAVDVKSGQIVYTCSAAGCQETTEANGGSGDLLVITQNMQTVRAVDVTSGAEKWNFSVGQHDMLYVSGNKDKPSLQHSSTNTRLDNDEELILNCTPTDDTEDVLRLLEEDHQKRMVKVVVPDGQVVGLDPVDPSQMAWSRKFDSPVAKAWFLHRGKLAKISLFDSSVVPALSAESFPPFKQRGGDPILYVGTHQRQLYVQQQETDPATCDMDLPWKDPVLSASAESAPRVTWRPYLKSAGAHTPLFSGNEHPNIPLLGGNKGKPGDADTAVTVWHDHYPFDTGYYLYPKNHRKKMPDGNWKLRQEEGLLSVSIWTYWKELISCSLLISVFFHFFITRFFHHPAVLGSQSGSLDKMDSKDSLQSNDSLPSLDDKPAEFKSRFADEFECLQRLGKGGYGIVFSARNKVDDQVYAVKRIAVPNRDGSAKKKMLREVRTLAMLEHSGIVRYFHSWIEDPPVGWQEERDKDFPADLGDGDGFSPSPTPDLSLTSTGPLHKDASSYSAAARPDTKAKQPLRQKPSLLADIMPFGVEGMDIGRQSFSKSPTGSGEFSMHSNAEVSTDESGSFSLGGDERGPGLPEEMSDSASVQRAGDHRSKESPCRSHYTSHFGQCGPDQRSGKSGDLNSSVGFDATEHSDSVVFDDSRSIGAQRLRFDATDNSDSVVFEHSQSTKAQRQIFNLNATDNSDSVVFEDSKSQRHFARRDNEQSDSVTFEHSHSPREKDCLIRSSPSANCTDSSYGGSLDGTNSCDNKPCPHHIVDFTLSSHGVEEQAAEGKDRLEGVREREEKRVVPKLYLYIQMQLCQPETLRDWLMAHTISRDQAKLYDIFEQIVSAVAYVHSKDLIHRDLKPSNIFFAMDQTVKVGDFGLVTAPETQGDNGGELVAGKISSVHTAEVGTQLYMSPEQVQKKPYDQKVDIFSLGLIFFELLMPFATNMERVTTLHNARKGHFPERFCRELVEPSTLVKQMMSSRPEERPTAQQILEHELLKDAPGRISHRIRSISGSSTH